MKETRTPYTAELGLTTTDTQRDRETFFFISTSFACFAFGPFDCLFLPLRFYLFDTILCDKQKFSTKTKSTIPAEKCANEIAHANVYYG